MACSRRTFALVTVLAVVGSLLLASVAVESIADVHSMVSVAPSASGQHNDTGDASPATPEVTTQPVRASPKLFTNADTTIFEPEEDWKEVLPNQHIPAGLEIRMDLAQGKKWARLIKQEPRPARARSRRSKASASTTTGAASSLAAPVDKSADNSVAVPVAKPADNSDDVPVATTGGGSGAASPAVVGGGNSAEVGEVAAATVTSGGDVSGEATAAKTVGEHERFETAKRVLAELPSPEPELVRALADRMPRAEMEQLLDRLWKKRQAELQAAMAAIQTDASVMQQLLKRVVEATRAALPEDGVAATIGGHIMQAEEASTEVVTPQRSAEWYLADVKLALEDLEYHVSDLDNAVDFSTMGGVAVMAQVLEHHPSESVKALAAWVIGSAVKYNRVVQQRVAESGLLLPLLNRLRQHAASSEPSTAEGRGLVSKLVYATGACVRGSGDLQLQFADLDGAGTLASIIARGSSDQEWQRVASKAAALVGDLAQEALARLQAPARKTPPSVEGDERVVRLEKQGAGTAAGNVAMPEQDGAFLAALLSRATCGTLVQALSDALTSSAPSAARFRADLAVALAETAECERLQYASQGCTVASPSPSGVDVLALASRMQTLDGSDDGSPAQRLFAAMTRGGSGAVQA